MKNWKPCQHLRLPLRLSRCPVPSSATDIWRVDIVGKFPSMLGKAVLLSREIFHPCRGSRARVGEASSFSSWQSCFVRDDGGDDGNGDDCSTAKRSIPRLTHSGKLHIF